MRTFIVALLTAIVVLSAVSGVAAAESSDSPAEDDAVTVDVSQGETAPAATDSGGRNWVRLIGLSGIIAVWWTRGFFWVSRRRKAKAKVAISTGDEGLDAAEQPRHLVEPERPGTA